jgi:ferredoxin-NADP reductase
MTKINCFLKDVSGASRVTKKREEAFKNASGDNNYKNPIIMVSRMLHPAPFLVTVSKIKDVAKTAKKYTLVPIDGFLPVFQAGNYVSIKYQIGNTITTRPYSICSAPYQTKLDNPYFEITVRNTLDGFISNYMYSSVKEGDTLTVEMPFGHFYYEPLRDSNNIVGIAGGSGITPFYSMAQEILIGTLDINLTILYGSISHKDIILYDELNEITKKSNKVKVIHVISGIDEELYDNDEKGYISKDIIKKYSIDNAP